MRIFFTSGRIIDGRGGLIERGSVLVEGEQIVACGADIPTPRDAERIVDLAGRTLMPGMIDTHVHLAGGDYHPERVHQPVPMVTLRSVEAARRTLMAGFTMVRYGMDPMQAIVAGTLNAATLLRREHWVGSIEPGKLADLIVIDGNPLDNIEALQHGVRFVMQGGMLCRSELT
jgi:imidazolonepropionase-like amidohydrolase